MTIKLHAEWARILFLVGQNTTTGWFCAWRSRIGNSLGGRMSLISIPTSRKHRLGCPTWRETGSHSDVCGGNHRHGVVFYKGGRTRQTSVRGHSVRWRPPVKHQGRQYLTENIAVGWGGSPYRIHAAMSSIFGTVAETITNRGRARVFMREMQTSSVAPRGSCKM